MAYNEFDNDTSKILLGSVNMMLNAVGLEDIETEEDFDLVLEARMARTDLIQAKKEILSSGWDVNTDDGYVLTPDSSGSISLPINILDVSSSDNDLVARNHYLYSKSKQSIRFDSVQTVNIKWDMEFNTLPFALRNYITMKAIQRFRDVTIGADSVAHSFTEADTRDAYMEARRSEASTSGASMLSPTFDMNRV
jgi:hypothetical protein